MFSVALRGAVSLASMVSIVPVCESRIRKYILGVVWVCCVSAENKLCGMLDQRCTSCCVVDGEEESSSNARTVSVHKPNAQ